VFQCDYLSQSLSSEEIDSRLTKLSPDISIQIQTLLRTLRVCQNVALGMSCFWFGYDRRTYCADQYNVTKLKCFLESYFCRSLQLVNKEVVNRCGIITMKSKPADFCFIDSLVHVLDKAIFNGERENYLASGLRKLYWFPHPYEPLRNGLENPQDPTNEPG
jgi:hypothetical protein